MKNITIQSIEVVNFMCHSNLRVDFNKMITCIGGRNGSGKSAVMIALGILFGQKARELDRGNNYRSLIKTGTNQAIIRVSINNYRNYKLERYGKSIVIEKKIREISTKISVYNHIGKIFNLKKNELEEIVEFFNLKLDNPLNFLTQDGSKKFLNLSSPKTLYEFYYVGTEFKAIDEDLMQSRSIIEELNNRIIEADEQLCTIEGKLVGHYSELKFLEYDPDSTLRRLENEVNWLTITTEQETIVDYTSEIAEYNTQIKNKELERAGHQASLELVFEEKSTKDQEEECSRLLVQKHSVEEDIEEYKTQKSLLEVKIEQIKRKNNTEKLTNEIETTQSILDDQKRLLNHLEESKEGAFQRMQREQEENQVKSDKIYNYKRQIEYLKQNAFDQNKKKENEKIARIRQEINKGSFKDVVIGPLFDFITLKEPKWYRAVSIILKKSLTNFIVFNNEDKIKIYNIFNQLQIDYSVSQMRSKKAYTGLKTNKDYKTVLDILEIKNDIVSNQLITSHNIEQITLIENRDLAHSAILKNPVNVDCAYTPSGDRIKLVNGSLSDFRQRDDGYYWFEDKISIIQKYEYELKTIVISTINKDNYYKISSEIESITPKVEALGKKLRDMVFELEVISNFEENDTVGLERGLKLLGGNIKSLTIKRASLEERIQELETLTKQKAEYNIKRKSEINRIKDYAHTEMVKVDHDTMVLNNKIAVKTQERDSLIKAVDAKIANSTPRPEIIRDIVSINKEKKIAIDFKQRAKEMISKEALEDTIKKLEIKKDNLTAIVTKFQNCLAETTEVFKKRIAKKDEIKGKNTIEAIESFKEFTARSGYEGIMTIDHENKELDLKMKVHNSSIAGSKSTLSGGERSFAGVCFLLSMWKCFKCPIKVLDEFDVFMDSLNRKMSICSLFEFFKENDVQVILITPLDTKDLEDADCDIKVLKKIETS